MKKYNTITVLHIIAIITGTLFLSIGLLNDNLWFDEAYTVGLARHSFVDILKISFYDVHPPFYYIALKLFTLIFGGSLLALRTFSLMFWAGMGILGFTHIRHDFGEKIGLLFSFFMLFSVSGFIYATEIRMYSIAPFIVTLAAIYAYRYYKSDYSDKKSRILFLVFAVLAAYTHHYGLITVVAINFMLFINHIKSKRFKLFAKNAAIQLIAFIPGFAFAIRQFDGVSNGFWIEMKFPDIFFNIVGYFFAGDIHAESYDIIFLIIHGVSVLIVAAMSFFAYRYSRKNKAEAAAGRRAIYAVLLVLAFVFAVSLHRHILVPRYISVISSLVFFAGAFFLVKINKKYLTIITILFITVSLVVRMVPVLEKRFDSDNNKLDEFVLQNFQEGDILVSESYSDPSVIGVQFEEYKCYFLNSGNWSVYEAYKAFGPFMSVVGKLEDIGENSELAEGSKKRIWITRVGNYQSIIDFYKKIMPNATITEYEAFHIPNFNIEYSFTLIEQ